ncbi:hypothetical protein EVAR_55261_1 [Eumeta japonica]|uniref:Uncharacterized protein n=1 Tax=Eumeta variegata TaxID=151549 RepID=A0A4C1Z207_EUMVA|nr:hypothetical protein EVAR_55261_1 [Eumeta japonica]
MVVSFHRIPAVISYLGWSERITVTGNREPQTRIQRRARRPSRPVLRRDSKTRTRVRFNILESSSLTSVTVEVLTLRKIGKYEQAGRCEGFVTDHGSVRNCLRR